MKLPKAAGVAVLIASALAWCSRAGAAEVLFDRTGFLSGQESFAVPLNISGPGTLTVTLTNIAWPEELASLNMVLGTPSGLMGGEMGPGTDTFKVTGGMVYAQWFGQAQGPLNLGVYSIDIAFQPDQVTVPLPASALLLVSGLMLLGWRRHQSGAMRVAPKNG